MDRQVKHCNLVSSEQICRKQLACLFHLVRCFFVQTCGLKWVFIFNWNPINHRLSELIDSEQLTDIVPRNIVEIIIVLSSPRLHHSLAQPSKTSIQLSYSSIETSLNKFRNEEPNQWHEAASNRVDLRYWSPRICMDWKIKIWHQDLLLVTTYNADESRYSYLVNVSKCLFSFLSENERLHVLEVR